MKIQRNNKEIIILRHIGGRFGNQLWLFSNVYAFCLERGYKCLNPSFYAYNKYFNLNDENWFTKFFEYLSNPKINRSHAASFIIYTLYKYCSGLMPFFRRGTVIKSNSNENINNLSEKIMSSRYQKVYLDCNELNNPEGVKKYRDQVVDKFKPKKEIVKKVDDFLNKHRGYYLVAVHIRQGDYKRFVNGRFYFDQSEVSSILGFFIEKRYHGKKKVKFILFSDSVINLDNFSGLNVELGFGPDFMIEDMLTMSKCNLIIAARSSFSTYAAYYGGKTLYVFDHHKKLVPFNIYENTIFT